MGVYIKGETKPESCDKCLLYRSCDRWHAVLEKDKDGHYMPRYKATDCPIVEVPPHGDLVDFYELIDKYWEGNRMEITAWDLKEIPTVIGAEE